MQNAELLQALRRIVDHLDEHRLASASRELAGLIERLEAIQQAPRT